MTSGLYVLVGQTPVEEANPLTWAAWFETYDRRVRFTRLPWCYVSTIFLGIDHSFRPMGPPVLFESMAFWPGDSCEEQDRCSTWMEAEAMHAAMVREVSRPSRICAWLGRLVRRRLSQAKQELKRAISDRPLSEWERSMRQLEEKVSSWEGY